ncbi:MAG: GNAT family N-acetyltransferase [Alphaproteobacteria bacterium]|nr:GNAT family N-acetyltransferase [Alphaproteobacteria bacterium]
MANPGDISGIEFGPMELGERDAIRDLIAGTFSRYEPMAVAMGQSYAEFQALIGLFLADAAFRDPTICARQTGSTDIVGVMLATDFTTALPAGVETASPSFPPIGGVIDRLEDWYRDARSPQPGECLDLAMLAVARDQGGRGIAQKLVNVSLESAAAQGYRRAITMATNRISLHVFQKLGFKELFSVSYKDYTFAGNRVFAAIEPDDRTALMEQVL